MIARMTRTAAVLLLVLCVRAWATDPEVRTYEGHRLLKVDAGNAVDLAAIEATGAVVLNCIPGPGVLDVVASPAQVTQLQTAGLNYRVIEENIRPLIEAQMRQPAHRADPFTDFFLAYHRYGDPDTEGTIVWYLHQLAGMYPNLASTSVIGYSLENRPIWAIRIANDAVPGPKPAVFYYCCQHAREWITTTVAPYHARHLLQNYATDPNIRDMVDHVEIFLVPVTNPDGYEFTWTNDRLWRKNRRLNSNGTIGVDLNRNWDSAWGLDNEGSSGTPGSATYRGTAPFSEPETQVLRDFFIAHPNIRAALDIHSFSQLILWPWGYTSDLCPDNAEFAEVGLAMQELIYDVHGKFYTAGPTFTTIYPVNGDGTDWAYEARGAFALSFELRPLEGPFGSGFELPPAEIIPNNEELLPAMLYLTNAPWVRSPVRIDLPAGVPNELVPGVATTIPVTVRSNFETLAPGSAKFYYRYDAEGPYIEVPLTPLGGDDYQVVLPATHCASTPEFYFAADSIEGSRVMNPLPGPNAPYRATLATGQFHLEDFEIDPGWTIAPGSEWEWGTPQGRGTVSKDPTSAFSGTKVYGYDLSNNGEYAVSMPPTYLTSTPIDCTGRYGVRLSFWRWLGVESSFNFDEATLEVSNDGGTWTMLFRATATGANIIDTAWKYQEFDISAVADNQPTVYLRWGIGPTDEAVTYCGWNIDDVGLYATACVSGPADHNGDGAVDLGDFPAFAACANGPAGGLAPDCRVFDLDDNSRIDLADYAALQRMIGAP
jgi:murein tripeptide amidase MpaA